MNDQSLSTLNTHLFDQLDRLSKDDLSADEVEREIKRAEAIVDVSDQILGSANTALKAAKLFAEHGKAVLPHLPKIGSKPEPEDKT